MRGGINMTNQYFATPKKLFSGDDPLMYNSKHLFDLTHGDFNCDGNEDLVFASLNHMFISFGNVDGTFTQPQVFEDELYKKMLLVGGGYAQNKQLVSYDINGDGRPDLVVLGGNQNGESNVFTFLNIFECPTTSSTTTTGTSFISTDTSTSSITATVTNTSTVPTDTSSTSSTIDATTMFKLVESTVTTTTDTATTKTQTIITDTSTTETMFTTATTTNGVAEEENRKSGISVDSDMKSNIALGLSAGCFLLLLGGFAYINHKINNMKHCATLPKSIAVVNPSYNGGVDTNTAQQQQSFYEQPVPVTNAEGTYGNNAPYDQIDTNV